MTALLPRLLALAAFVAAAGCAGKTDVSEGVDQLNAQILAPQGAELDCPGEVDGGAGTTFECTMRAIDGSETAAVRMQVVEQDGDLAVGAANDEQYEKALAAVAGGR